ncbi:hypothetical protein CBR_g57126 [Chara braunii]|uniref:Reverse transcriptase zinc-binding domain-containing protein n=1 Tax=Chara braunii TaxID=69332 RepID=A0A388MDY7_CHABU|nr:hypothetical protein CBR_g57126 [Chara braunii]|eukprot:GBG92776.1 hypothetical protein CBR_g57126 [Chara braunii]
MPQLFENSYIIDQNGSSFEVTGAGTFGRKWIEKGVLRVKDLWDEGRKRWKTEVELREVLGRLREVGFRLRELIEAIPAEWKEELAKSNPRTVGGWYKEEQQQENNIQVLRLEEKLEDDVWSVTRWGLVSESNSGSKMRRIREDIINTDQHLMPVRVCLIPSQRRGGEYLLIQNGAAIQELRWDPVAYSWNGIGHDRKTLANYDMKLGRQVQKPPDVNMEQICERLARTFNMQSNPSIPELKSIWASLPHLPSLKLAGLMWLLSHSAIPSAKWLADKGMDVDRQCRQCGNTQEETTYHLIWDCPTSERIWRWLADHWQRLGSALVWDEKWVVGGQLPPLFFRHRGWGYMAQAIRSAITWVIWEDRNSILFREEWSSDVAIHGKIKTLIRTMVVADWVRRADKGRLPNGRRWFLFTWARSNQLAAVTLEGKLALSPWLCTQGGGRRIPQ